MKAILIERRGLTTPESVNKVISGGKLGSDIQSRFLRRLKKTGFGTKVVVSKAVIRQAFIRQMPPSVRAHLATQPDSASLENLAMLADRAVAAEKDVDEAKPGDAEINVSESGKLVGLLEDLSRRHKKLETAKATQKKTYGRSQASENRTAKTQFVPNVRAKPFIPNNQAVTRQDVSNNNKKDSRPNAPPPQNNVAQPIDTADAPVCFYHQTFGDRARTCREPCVFSLN